MRQFTTPEQTAKLIELGFVPEVKIKEVQVVHSEIQVDHDCNFPIGKLIEVLPRCIETPYDTAVLEISYDSDDGEWYCGHRWCYNRGWRRFGDNYKTIDDTELVDALYRYIVELKEEGVI